MCKHLASEASQKAVGSNQNPISYYYGLELTWILTNIAFGPDQIMSQLLVEKGSVSGVFEFIKHLITHGDTSQRCMVLWLIANITGECKVNAKLVADNIDIATILYGLMNVPTQFSEIVQLVTWNINNLARHSLIRQSDFPKIGTILTYSINNFKDFDAIWAMSKLLNTTEEGLLILC